MKGSYYELLDLERDELGLHGQTFEQIDSIGFEIFDDVLSGDVLEDYMIPIRSMLYRLLEFNDTLSVMVANSLINTSFPLIRSSFEILAQLCYVLNEKEEMALKAMVYHYCDYRQHYKECEIEAFNERMADSIHFASIHQSACEIPKSHKLSWYGLYRKKRTTFKELCDEVHLDEHYLRLYPHFSADIHGNACLELNTVCFEDGGKYYLRHFRHFERHHSLMILQIDIMRRAFLSLKNCFSMNKGLAARIEDFDQRATQYVDAYWSIKGSPIDPLPEFSI